MAKFADFWWKNADVSSNQGVCHMIYIYFLDLLWLRYSCAKFHHYSIYVTDFMKGGLFAPPPSVSSPKKAHPE